MSIFVDVFLGAGEGDFFLGSIKPSYSIMEVVILLSYRWTFLIDFFHEENIMIQYQSLLQDNFATTSSDFQLYIFSLEEFCSGIFCETRAAAAFFEMPPPPKEVFVLPTSLL